MTDLDRRLRAATDELRRDVAQIDPPPFEPSTQVAPMLAAAVLALAIGLFAVFSMLGSDDGAVEVIMVDDVEEVDAEPDDSIDEEEAVEPTPLPAPEPETRDPAVEDPFTDNEAEATVGVFAGGGPQLVGPVTAMTGGRMALPVDGVDAWNADETMMLVYRRIDGGSEHVVIDAATGADLVVLDIDPPDIEQVYWSPTEPFVIYFANEGTADLMALDVASGNKTKVHTFDGCESISSGLTAVAPSAVGDFGFVCYIADGSMELIAFDSGTQTEARRPTDSDYAPSPSPSGDYYVMWNEDGSASVLDPNLADTGVMLQLYDNSYVFVVDGDGRESVAAAIYDGPAVGTLVVLPLDTGVPQVIIGPDAGDEYPPSGTRLASVGVNGQVAISVAGPETTDSALAGRVLAVDLAAPGDSQVTVLGSHGSAGQFDYWSSAFVSISPSGRFVMTSSDDGGDSVNTRVLRIPD